MTATLIWPKSFWFLGQPYSNNPEFNYEAALVALAEMQKRDIVAYSPIAHWHVVAQLYQMPRGYTYWAEHNAAMVTAAARLIIYELPGWEQSQGLKVEIGIATQMNKPFARLSRTLELDLGGV